MNGRLINEAEVLRQAGDLARVAPSEYARMKGILSRCPTVNTEGVPLEEEPMGERIKRAVAEKLASFQLPDGLYPKSVRLTVQYAEMVAWIDVDIPREGVKT